MRFANDDTTMRQLRTIRYQDITEDLRSKLDAGAFAVGRLLPSEAELSHTYEASLEARIIDRPGFCGGRLPLSPM